MKRALGLVLLAGLLGACHARRADRDRSVPSPAAPQPTPAAPASTPAPAPTLPVREVTSGAPPLDPDETKNGAFSRIFLDPNTGLHWSNVIDGSLTQSDAVRACARLNGGSAGDGWRLPTRDELKQVALDGLGAHSISIGDNGSSLWSATANMRDTSRGWVVTIAGAATDDALTVSQRPVLCVRGENAAMR